MLQRCQLELTNPSQETLGNSVWFWNFCGSLSYSSNSAWKGSFRNTPFPDCLEEIGEWWMIFKWADLLPIWSIPHSEFRHSCRKFSKQLIIITPPSWRSKIGRLNQRIIINKNIIWIYQFFSFTNEGTKSIWFCGSSLLDICSLMAYSVVP